MVSDPCLPTPHPHHIWIVMTVDLRQIILTRRLKKLGTGNVTKTIADVTLLEAFIRTLPTAFDGTEDTGKGGEGIDNNKVKAHENPNYIDTYQNVSNHI